MRWGDGLSVEQPGDVWGRVSFSHAGETSRRAGRDDLVGQTLRHKHGLCGGEARNINIRTSSAANSPRSPKNLHLIYLTENIHSIVSAGYGSLLGLSSTGVAPFVAPHHRSEGQVVVLSLVRRSWRDLLTVLKPPGCRCRTTGHDTLQHQRLRLLHGDGHRGGGVNYPD